MAKINDNFATIADNAKHKAMKGPIKIIEMWAKETFLALNKKNERYTIWCLSTALIDKCTEVQHIEFVRSPFGKCQFRQSLAK